MPKRRKAPEFPRRIVIEGPIGVGKTTFAEALAERAAARLVLEEVEENPFLKRFYAEPEEAAFQTQLFFLLSRFRQQQTLLQEDLFQRTTVADYLFEKDRIFATLNLRQDELALYGRIYELLDTRIPPPDLVVFLQARTDVLMDRVRMRNRPWERGITEAYLEKISAAYADFFFHWTRSPLLIVNTSDIDFVEREQDLEDLIGTVRRMKKGTQVYNPLSRS
ncbi:MAG: deoxynucleoside kinase [Myxococcota bacterium]